MYSVRDVLREVKTIETEMPLEEYKEAVVEVLREHARVHGWLKKNGASKRVRQHGQMQGAAVRRALDEILGIEARKKEA